MSRSASRDPELGTSGALFDALRQPEIYDLHAVVGAGALSDDGSRWVSAGKEYLFPVRALSKMFRGKFVAGLRRLLGEGKLQLPAAPEKKAAWEWILLLTGDDIRKCPDCQHPLEESEIPPLPRYATFRVQHAHPNPSRAPPGR